MSDRLGPRTVLIVGFSLMLAVEAASDRAMEIIGRNMITLRQARQRGQTCESPAREADARAR